MAGHVMRGERPEGVAVGERRQPPDGHVAEPRAQRLDRLGVVGMVVRQRDPARAAALRDRGGQRVEVHVERRAGVEDPGRVAPDDVAVGAVERVGRRVRRPDEQDLHGAQRGAIR